jgi:hypothetical protein
MTEYNIKSYMALQRVEMEEHRWYMGEKRNRHIKDYELLEDWIMSGHAERFQSAYLHNLTQAENLAELFGDNIPNSLVHMVLED